jgi:hypothetical protein
MTCLTPVNFFLLGLNSKKKLLGHLAVNIFKSKMHRLSLEPNVPSSGKKSIATTIIFDEILINNLYLQDDLDI